MTQNEAEIAIVAFGGGMLVGSWITVTIRLAPFRLRQRPLLGRESQSSPDPELLDLASSTGSLAQRLDYRIERLEERADFSDRMLETVSTRAPGSPLQVPSRHAVGE